MKARSKINRFLVSLIALCLIPCLVGCDTMHEYTLTGSMWDNGLADNHHEAAANANLALSRTRDGRDVLVEYCEANENNEHLAHRAFLLYQNEREIDAKKRPHFISSSQAKKLRAAPIAICSESNAPPAAPPQIYAVLSTNGTHFTIVTDGFEKGPYALPTYLDAQGRTVRILLTPATATCDVVLWTAAAATVVGLVAACAYVQGHSY